MPGGAQREVGGGAGGDEAEREEAEGDQVGDAFAAVPDGAVQAGHAVQHLLQPVGEADAVAAALLVRPYAHDREAQADAAQAEEDEVAEGADAGAGVAECVELLAVRDQHPAQGGRDNGGNDLVVAQRLEDRAGPEQYHGGPPGPQLTAGEAAREHDEQDARGERGGPREGVGEPWNIMGDSGYPALAHPRPDGRGDVEQADEQAGVTGH